MNVGDACANRMIDNHGRNEGCRGRLVVEMCREKAPRRYVPDPAGTVAILVCPRCGQAHGPAPDPRGPCRNCSGPLGEDNIDDVCGPCCVAIDLIAADNRR